MWNTKDHRGNPVTYYEEQEYKKLENDLARYRRILYNVYAASFDNSIVLKHFFYGCLQALGLLDAFSEKRGKEGWNVEDVD